MLKAFKHGLDCLAEGYRLASSPEIRPFLYVPVLFNLILFAGLGYGGYSVFDSLLGAWDWSVELPSWLGWLQGSLDVVLGVLRWLILVALLLLMVLIMGHIFTMVTHTLAGPFLGVLGEKVERRLREVSYPEHQWYQIIWRTLAREWIKLRYWGFRALGLALVTLICYVIPPLQVITPVLWYLFGAWIMAMSYLDIAADNNGLGFPGLLAAMQQQRPAVLGFGGAVMVLTTIPIVNLFIVPIAVAGAVVFWVRHLQPQLSDQLSQES